jgi:enoyl-CoA hydratase/carnithine racemase
MTSPGEPVELVHLEVADRVATVTLDSPANRNALSVRLGSELAGRLREADATDTVRVVMLTHTGSTFCSGADLAEAAANGMVEGTRSLLGLLRLVVELSKPVVAVVRGHVRAGGIGLVGACDVAVVTDTSTFAFSEALLGLAPAVISLTTSSRLTDREAAYKYLSGVTFDGVEAARCGLATFAVAPDGLADRLSSVVSDLTRASPQGLLETKRLLNERVLQRMDRDGDALVALSARLFGSDEAREAMAAFRERRPPRWDS